MAYKQLKVSVESELAESFKVACLNAGVSMAAEISEFMTARSGVLSKQVNNSTFAHKQNINMSI